jgi:hypothetical protein
MGDPIDLTHEKNPIFIAEYILVDKAGMVIGREKGGCSYYTNITVKGEIRPANFEELKKALAEELGKSKGE